MLSEVVALELRKSSPTVPVPSRARPFYRSIPLIQLRASIEILPNEIISYIFIVATHESHDRHDTVRTPITISHVCRHWREISLSISCLWTTVILTYPCPSFQISRSVTWLARSRKSPLDIVLDFRDPSWNWEENSHSFRWRDMEGVMRLLLPHVSRWRLLELLTDTWAPIFTFLYYTRRVESAPVLQSLSLSRCNAYFASKGESFQPTVLRQPIPLFGGGSTCPRLRRVSLAGVHVDWTNSGLRDLVEFELKYHASDIMPSLKQFMDILAACPNLERLAILGWGPRLDSSAEDNDEEPIQWAQLQRSIRLPRVTYFSLGFVDVEYAVDLLSLFCLPALQELSFEDVSASLNPIDTQDASAILEYLAANHAAACPSASHTPSCCAFQSIPLSKIHILDFHTIQASEDAFSRFLHMCSSLERLSLSNMESDVLHALDHSVPIPPSSQTSGASGLPCPSLAELICRGMEPRALVRTVEARAQSGIVAPFKKVVFDVRDASPYIGEEERVAFLRAGVRVLDNHNVSTFLSPTA